MPWEKFYLKLCYQYSVSVHTVDRAYKEHTPIICLVLEILELMIFATISGIPKSLPKPFLLEVLKLVPKSHNFVTSFLVPGILSLRFSEIYPET